MAAVVGRPTGAQPAADVHAPVASLDCRHRCVHVALCMCLVADSSSPVCYSHWQSVGPFSIDPGTDLGRPAGIGGVSGYYSVSILEAFVGTAHGGVWRSRVSAHSVVGAHWEAVTDHMPCSSISVIAGSIDDEKVVAAGCGLDSSGDRRDGEPMGVMITIDRGNT